MPPRKGTAKCSSVTERPLLFSSASTTCFLTHGVGASTTIAIQRIGGIITRLASASAHRRTRCLVMGILPLTRFGRNGQRG